MSESDPVVQHNPFPPAPPLPAHLDTMTHRVLAMVLAERERQIAKGYDAAHDDQHADGSILDFVDYITSDVMADSAPDDDWTKTGTWTANAANSIRRKYHADPVRRLVIAAALLVAEVGRLERAKASAESAADMTARADAHVAAVQSGDEEPERWDGQE